MALRDASLPDFRARYRAAGSRRLGEPNVHELENRFGLLGPTRVQIPPPPLKRARRQDVRPCARPSVFAECRIDWDALGRSREASQSWGNHMGRLFGKSHPPALPKCSLFVRSDHQAKGLIDPAIRPDRTRRSSIARTVRLPRRPLDSLGQPSPQLHRQR